VRKEVLEQLFSRAHTSSEVAQQLLLSLPRSPPHREVAPGQRLEAAVAEFRNAFVAAVAELLAAQETLLKGLEAENRALSQGKLGEARRGDVKRKCVVLMSLPLSLLWVVGWLLCYVNPNLLSLVWRSEVVLTL